MSSNAQEKASSNGGKRRVVVLGLDGAPYTLLDRFTRDGLMPSLAEVYRQGAVAPMDTALPEISATAWTSFMTGTNPGRHAVYGFLDLDPRNYKLQFTNFNSVKAPTLWDHLSRRGMRSVILNIPTTYPARPLEGVMVSGFVAIDLKRATWPTSLLPYLEGMGYKLDVDTTVVKDGSAALVAELSLALERREQALEELLRRERFDLYVGVVTETDRLHHYLWAALEDPAHEHHQFFLDYYRRIDRFIGRVAALLRPDDLFLIMSDHGFCKIDREVYLNVWLREQGYLDFTRFPPSSHADIAPGSRAFFMDPARLHVHERGRYPNGTVEPGPAAEALADEISARLRKLEVDGRPVVQHIFRKEELYHGPFLAQAPDRVLVPHRGFDLKGTIVKNEVTGNSLLTGMHTHDDAVMYCNRGIAKAGKVHIHDLAPTILGWLGVELPGELDGVSLV